MSTVTAYKGFSFRSHIPVEHMKFFIEAMPFKDGVHLLGSVPFKFYRDNDEVKDVDVKSIKFKNSTSFITVEFMDIEYRRYWVYLDTVSEEQYAEVLPVFKACWDVLNKKS